QATNDADFLVSRLPGFTHVSAERVVADALKAADHGHASVVPGGPQVRLALGSTRFVRTALVLPVLKRMLKRYLEFGVGIGLSEFPFRIDEQFSGAVTPSKRCLIQA